ncbi:MAG: hypothetical protein HYZ53_23035 [Planctomycetes bacterium]|nr:hypothetical protein [Planctomycetota bacterium]
MANVTLETVTRQLELAEQLWAGRNAMFEPQDLPGRFGRVIRSIDQLLEALGCEAVLAGGWAVWRHGFLGRLTRDVDIVLAADQVDAFLRAASVSGFVVLPQPPGRWPKLLHEETEVRVDILPEGQRPGTASRPAPTTIPHPARMGATRASLKYIALESLVELKLAAGRLGDEHDVVELIRGNPERLDDVRRHLAAVHVDYVAAFERLVERSPEQQDA